MSRFAVTTLGCLAIFSLAACQQNGFQPEISTPAATANPSATGGSMSKPQPSELDCGVVPRNKEEIEKYRTKCL